MSYSVIDGLVVDMLAYKLAEYNAKCRVMVIELTISTTDKQTESKTGNNRSTDRLPNELGYVVLYPER